MRLFWKKPDEKEYKAKYHAEEEINSSPTVNPDTIDVHSSAKLNTQKPVIDSKTSKLLLKARFCALFCYSTDIPVGWIDLCAYVLLWICTSLIIYGNNTLLLHMTSFLYFVMTAWFTISIFYPDVLTRGLLLQISKSQPQLALPIIARLCGNKQHKKISDEAKKGFITAFQTLGAEKSSSLLSRRNRQMLYQGLIKNIAEPNTERVSPDDTIYCEAVLNLLDLHPDSSVIESLENLACWAPWPLVERGRLIAMRLKSAQLRSNQAHKGTETMARLLYDLGNEDLTISLKAEERIRAFNQHEIISLLAFLSPLESKAFRWLVWIIPLLFMAIASRITHFVLSPVTYLWVLCISAVLSVRLNKLYYSNMLLKKMVTKTGPNSVLIPWQRLIETIKQTNNLEIVHELIKIQVPIGVTSARSRAIRNILTELLPCVCEANAPILDLNNLTKKLGSSADFLSTNISRFQVEDYLFIEAIVGVLALQGNENSLNRIRKLYKNLGFVNLDGLNTETNAKKLEFDQEEIKSTRLRLQLSLRESYRFLEERIGAGNTPGILLRASSAPVKSDTLLRPTNKVSITPTEELLRPTENDDPAINEQSAE